MTLKELTSIIKESIVDLRRKRGNGYDIPIRVGSKVVMDDGKRLTVDMVNSDWLGIWFWGTDQDGKDGQHRRANIVRVEKTNDESVKNALKSIIRESLEEIKVETEKSVHETMVSLSKFVKEYNKNFSIKKSKKGHYEMCGCLPHHIEIGPMYQDNFEVVYFKDNSDREKKMNLDAKGVKDFIKEKLESKEGNYVKKAYNKASKNSEDVVKKESELPETKTNPIKNLTDKKNDNKDYTEVSVKKEQDLPDKPMAEVGKLSKLSDHPKAGDKVKYTYPKQTKAEKTHLMKGGKGKELKLPETKIKKK